MTMQDLARRLTKLEETVAEMSQVQPRTGAWYLARSGKFKGDPVYDEIVTRGRAFRESLRPKRQSKQR